MVSRRHLSIAVAFLLGAPAAVIGAPQPLSDADFSASFSQLSLQAKQSGAALRSSQTLKSAARYDGRINAAVRRLREMRSFDPDLATDRRVMSLLAEMGHLEERHGPDVTDEYLIGRGIKRATHFVSWEAMLASARESWRAAEVAFVYDEKFLKEMEKIMKGKRGKTSFRFMMREPVGRGLRRTPEGYVPIPKIRLVTAVFHRQGDRIGIYTLYPQAP